MTLTHVLTGLGVLAGLYVALCLLMFVGQSRFVYFPDRELRGTPQVAGMRYRDVWLHAADGTRLHAWFVPGPEAKPGDRPARGAHADADPGAGAGCAVRSPVLLVCHGNGGNISDRLELLQLLRTLGCSVLLFDYRGYGRSDGVPSEDGTYRDADAAWHHLVEVEGIDPTRIVLFGRSLGGAVAVELASRRPVGGLILEGTFSSLAEVGQRHYRWLPVRLLSRYRYDSASRIGAVGCPILFLHSREDEVIPFELGRRLFEAAPEPKRFVETTGGHMDAFAQTGARYREELAAFLDACGS